MFDEVYLKHDPEQHKFMIVAIEYDGIIKYSVQSGATVVLCLEEELSTEKILQL